ncbi:MAG: winged helix-turn-helix domain-containing protein, partial [Pyrinomonadaceae bacterium]
MSKQVRYLYEFGPFRIDTANRLLLRDGKPIPLKPKVVDTLFALIENSGRVMEKDELIEKLWPDSYVEEGNLTQNIYELRKVLHASSERGSYIETIPRRGYRFAVQVNRQPYEESANLVKSDEVTAARADRADVDHPEPETRAKALVTPEVAEVGARISKRSALIFSVVLAGILIGMLYYLSSKRSRPVVSKEIKSLAILPFKSLNPEAADEYIGQGMADALITKLSNSHRIAVRPTSAVLRYGAPDTDPLLAGRELSVDAVLDGKVQQLGDRVRVTVQLLRVADGAALWAEKFDAKLTDIFAVQDSISDQAAHSLTLRLTGDERELMRKHYTQNFEAYQAY